MNREIKFKFYYRNPLSGKYTHLFEQRACGGINSFFKGTLSTIKCQFSGLKDKNGNDIYEGDIVQYNRRSSYDGMNFEVAWSEDLWGWSLVCRKSGDYLTNEMTPDGHRYKFIEVVGNIYENPELCQ